MIDIEFERPAPTLPVRRFEAPKLGYGCEHCKDTGFILALREGADELPWAFACSSCGRGRWRAFPSWQTATQGFRKVG